jgi:hypothetical protein
VAPAAAVVNEDPPFTGCPSVDADLDGDGTVENISLKESTLTLGALSIEIPEALEVHGAHDCFRIVDINPKDNRHEVYFENYEGDADSTYYVYSLIKGKIVPASFAGTVGAEIKAGAVEYQTNGCGDDSTHRHTLQANGTFKDRAKRHSPKDTDTSGCP